MRFLNYPYDDSTPLDTWRTDLYFQKIFKLSIINREKPYLSYATSYQTHCIVVVYNYFCF